MLVNLLTGEREGENQIRTPLTFDGSSVRQSEQSRFRPFNTSEGEYVLKCVKLNVAMGACVVQPTRVCVCVSVSQHYRLAG